MQRALHGSRSRRCRRRSLARDDVVVRGTLVDDPDGTRFSASVLVRVDRLALGARRDAAADGGGCSSRASGDVAGHASAAERRARASTLRGLARAARRASTTDGGGSTRSASCTRPSLLDARRARAPLARIANRRTGAGARGAPTHLAAHRPRAARRLPPRRHPGVPDDVTEQFRAAGLTHLTAVLGRERRVRPRAVRAAAAPARAARSARGRRSAVLVLFGTMTRWEPSVLRAIAMAVDRAARRLPRSAHRRAPGPRAGRDRAARRRPVPPALGRASCSRAARASASRCWRGRSPPGSAVRWVREVLGVTAAAQIGVAPVLIPVFGSMPLVACRRTWSRSRSRRRSRCGVSPAASSAVSSDPFAPQIPSLLTVPTAALLHALLAVADLAVTGSVAIDGRAAWGLVALAALVARRRSRASRRTCSEVRRHPPVRDRLEQPRRGPAACVAAYRSANVAIASSNASEFPR